MVEQLEAVQRMQDFIEVNLNDNITLSDLSKVSMFSPWYSYRLLKQYTNLTPSNYIRKLRLSKSAMRLRDEKQKITDVAFEIGFGSVDGYQRAFLKEFGINPSEYSIKPVPLYLFTPYGAKYKTTMKEERKMETIKNVFIQVIEKPARKVIIKRGVKARDYFTYCEEVGCDVWGLLTSIKSINGEPVCLWLPQTYRTSETSEYVQGVEVPISYDGEVPDGFDVIELPKAKYLMFQGEPFAEEDYCKAIEDVTNSIAKYDPTLIGYAWDKINPRIQLEPIGTRGYIELVAIK